jgi:adenosine deaminase
MNENLSAVPLSRDEVVTLTRNGFRAAFCDDGTKQRYLSELDAYSLSRR